MKKFFNFNCNLNKFLLFFIAATFLIGCGFQMGSKASLSPKLNKVYFQADNEYESLAIKFKNELVSYGIILVKNPADAPYKIHFFPTTFTHTTSTSGPSTQARVYNLIYTSSFSISDAKGKTIVSPRIVSSSRNLTLAPNEIFEVSTQVDVTKTSMEQELVVMIFNILSSPLVSGALNSTAN